ncbi:MAG: hypothetical protein N4A59_10495, partial [Marinifilum sp.]|nr:hypothetical protein [Marinifilum sp.]
MRKIFCLLIVPLILLTAINSCKNKKVSKRKVDPGFGQYIAAFTSGVVSAESIIEVRLVNDYKNPIEPGQELEAGIFTVTPKLSGKAYWKDPRTIEFRADSKMKSGGVYNVNVKIGKLMEVPEKYNNLKFSFQVIKQSFSFTGEGLQSYDKSDMKSQKYKGYLTTADIINDDEIESVLTASLDGEEKPIGWTHSGDGKVHRFVVDSLQRSEDKRELII